jgi:hypothetical protein
MYKEVVQQGYLAVKIKYTVNIGKVQFSYVFCKAIGRRVPEIQF